MLVILAKTKISLPFEVYILSLEFSYGYTDAPFGWLTKSLDRSPGLAPPL